MLQGHSDGTWSVALPAEEVPPELPEPCLGKCPAFCYIFTPHLLTCEVNLIDIPDVLGSLLAASGCLFGAVMQE